ncbi:MAG: XRE family transcriptional regulator [Burkholderiales bacterium]
MSKASPSLASLPQEAVSALARLGGDLAVARLRRHESLRSWAQRLGVSVPTLMKMERGDPTVSAGIYATALWMMGRTGALAQLAAPETDRSALEADVRAAVSSRTNRAPKARSLQAPRSTVKPRAAKP